MKIIENLLEGAKALGACRKTDGIDTLDKLVALYVSPQGREFCAKHHYPSREQWEEIARHWSREDLLRRHIYIDEPSLREVVNPGTAVIVGKSIHFTLCGAETTQRIIALHGANVTVRASNYAVFEVDNDGTSKITITKDDTSLQL